MKKYKFPANLIKEYGEQTVRDYKSQNRYSRKRASRKAYKDAGWSSAYVAEACGFITEKQIPAFLEAIVDFACTTKLPKNFI